MSVSVRTSSARSGVGSRDNNAAAPEMSDEDEEEPTDDRPPLPTPTPPSCAGCCAHNDNASGFPSPCSASGCCIGGDRGCSRDRTPTRNGQKKAAVPQRERERASASLATVNRRASPSCHSSLLLPSVLSFPRALWRVFFVCRSVFEFGAKRRNLGSVRRVVVQ
jgi:hypothetical protein